jgi:hypothetical protein
MPRKKPVTSEDRDLAHIKDPNQWTHLLLPLKERTPQPGRLRRLAVLVNIDPNTYTLHEDANIFTPPDPDTPGLTVTAEDVIARGWTVD